MQRRPGDGAHHRHDVGDRREGGGAVRQAAVNRGDREGNRIAPVVRVGVARRRAATGRAVAERPGVGQRAARWICR